MDCQTRRRGVSLVEILVVIAILAIMIGLLLPAISSIRASSVHMQSVNNVRQINLSIQTLLSQNSDQIRTLPDGSKRQYKFSTNQTLFTQLLPLVCPNRPPNLDPSGSPLDWANWLAPRVPMFLSPADPSLAILDTPSHALSVGITSYAVNQMVFDKLLLYPASISDGTSQTIALGEHYYHCVANQEYLDYSYIFAANPAFPNGSGSRRSTFADTGCYDVVPVVENGVARPSQPGYTFQYRPKVADAWGKVLQTPHPAGLPVGLLDGSVRTLRPGVAESVYWALITPSGGEVVGDF